MEDYRSHKILVVDDDEDILELLEYNLSKEGYNVQTSNDGKSAISTAKVFLPDLILMDIMMPKMDGVEAARVIRDTPEIGYPYIIFLTARVEEYSEIAAFDVGADDYITKPIKPRALISRIAATFRREQKKLVSNAKIKFADLIIDKASYTIQKNGEDITLPKKEFELLYFLAKNPDRVYSREDLLTNIWGANVYVLARTVDVHIRKVREKIGEGYIKTVKGVGYKLSN